MRCCFFVFLFFLFFWRLSFDFFPPDMTCCSLCKYYVLLYRVWQLVIEHMQVPMFETHHRIYLHKYLNVFDHQQPHPVLLEQSRAELETKRSKAKQPRIDRQKDTHHVRPDPVRPAPPCPALPMYSTYLPAWPKYVLYYSARAHMHTVHTIDIRLRE